jgi:GNAT superfamily N-acetyltransferase
MTSQPLEFDGPRMVRREELAASNRLSKICFGGLDVNAPDEESPASFHPPRRGGLYVITHRGVPVSQIYIFHFQVKMYDGLLRIGSIGGVCTHPDYRGQGLAGRLLEHCTATLAKEGARLMLISGGRGLYTRVGCVPSGKYVGFSIQPGNVPHLNSGLKARLATRSDAAICSRLYHTEPVHFIRPPAKFADRLTHSYGYVHSEAYIIERKNQPAAYLLLGIPWEYLGQQPGAGVRHVREYAGSRTALVGALEHIMAQSKLQEIHWPAAWQDEDLIHLFEQNGLHGTPEPLSDHTMRIINFPGLMTDLHAYLDARLEKSQRRGLRFEQTGPLLGANQDDWLAIVRGQERLELSGAAMTHLVMGDPGEELSGTYTVPGNLADIVSALFPLPSFFPGLNYQ